MVLVIVESPSKAKTISRYLGKDYYVVASKGHVIDLPKSKLGIDTENNYQPKYEVLNRASFSNIKKQFEQAESLILAVDPDREGEAIGWHIARKLKLIKDNGSIVDRYSGRIQRITFHEITKPAILEALKTPGNINMNLVDAQQARRVLDRLVGYKLSPLLWKKLLFGLSAGRVQSVAVRIVIDRENERDAFKSKEYWNINAYLSREKNKEKFKAEYITSKDAPGEEEDKPEGFPFELVKFNGKSLEINSKKQSEEIVKNLDKENWSVSNIEYKEVIKRPSPPFSTSTLQQTASSVLGYTPSQTMKFAQKLYEGGHITYMRTDSLFVSPGAIDQTRKYIKKTFGENYLSDNIKVYKSKVKNIQEAHEAIRPTDVGNIGESMKLTGPEKRLYELIRKRTIATQMQNAVIENSISQIVNNGYTFQNIRSALKFAGFLILYPSQLPKNTEGKITPGQKLHLNRIICKQKFTDPPARYTEATLIKALEANGIGRPSTYAPTIATIIARKYIEKEGRFLKPTAIGKVVNKLLIEHFPNIVDISFTAGLEDKLDEIANGDVGWVNVIDNFYKGFEKDILKAEKQIKPNDYKVIGPSDEKCPVCKSKMIIKIGRYGEFLSCTKYPKCKGMKSINHKEESLKIKHDEKTVKEFYKPAPVTDEGKSYALKRGKYGYFWAHPGYPKQKDIKPLELIEQVFSKVYGIPPKSSDGKVMILKRGRFGEFWAHPNYPEQKEIKKINKRKIIEKKKELGINFK